MEREKKIELINEMKEQLAGNQLFKTNLHDYLQSILDDLYKQFDACLSWDEACRIQGKKKIIMDLIKHLVV